LRLDAAVRALLMPDGILVLETMMTKQAPRAIAGWNTLRDRAYGSTRVLLLQPIPTALPDGEIPDPALL
ncbi:MAG: hypothetical protein WCN98_21225, partial [Verrucomicrobiaceae bacterium]